MVDGGGNVIPDAVIHVQFSVVGPGEIAATGNANSAEMASFRPARNTFGERCWQLYDLKVHLAR